MTMQGSTKPSRNAWKRVIDRSGPFVMIEIISLAVAAIALLRDLQGWSDLGNAIIPVFVVGAVALLVFPMAIVCHLISAICIVLGLDLTDEERRVQE